MLGYQFAGLWHNFCGIGGRTGGFLGVSEESSCGWRVGFSSQQQLAWWL